MQDADFFGPMITSKLGYYVYVLTDPLASGSIAETAFYVGKGAGNRCFSHAAIERGKGEKALNEDEHKLATIRKIHEGGARPKVLIAAHGLTEDEAYQIEAILIQVTGLTNKQAGHYHGEYWLDSQQLRERYDHPIQRRDNAELSKCVLAVSLNKQDLNKLRSDDDAMKNATLGAWSVGLPRAKQVDYVVGTRNSLIVSIYKTKKDADGNAIFYRMSAVKKGGHARHRFDAERRADMEKELVGRSLHEDGATVTKMPSGGGYRFLPPLKF